MQFDDLNKKIREAAEQFHPVYDEQSWNNMESLLDKHMPLSKKDYRKSIRWSSFILLFMAIVFITIAYMVIRATSLNKGRIVLLTKEKPARLSAGRRSDIVLPLKRQSSKNSSPSGTSAFNATTNIRLKPLSPNKQMNQKPATVQLSILNKTGVWSPEVLHIPGMSTRSTDESFAGNKIYSDKRPYKNETEASQTNQPAEINKNEIESNDVFPDQNTAINVAVEENDIKIVGLKKSLKKKGNFRNSLEFNMSSGLDVSSVQLTKPGKASLVYGAGIGYIFSPKWNVRAGFFEMRKIYKAKPFNYHPPAKFWNDYPYLEDIHADCKLYEVPVILSYSFTETPSYSYFGSVGLSSYFMKKETYHYLSELPAGQYQSDTFSVNNENKHYLSSLRLSLGYKRKPENSNVSIIAEPYINLPLRGVGFGKVKLKSAGILVTLSIKPFAKNSR